MTDRIQDIRVLYEIATPLDGVSPEASLVWGNIPYLLDQYDRLNDFEQTQCAMLLEKMNAAEAELAESQRREQALLSGIEKYCGKIQQNCIRLHVEPKGETE